MPFNVPDHLARRHGGENFFAGGKKYAETLEVWGGLEAGHAVMDIGCGPGRMCIGIGERFGWSHDYHGFDVQADDIEFCQNTITPAHPGYKFFHFDLANSHYNKDGRQSSTSVRFPAADNSIDFTFATSIYTHFFVDDLVHYLSETARVGKPGSRTLSSWFLIEDVFKSRMAQGLRVRFDFPFRAEDGTYYQHEKSPLDAVGHDIDVVRKLHEEAGLRVLDVYKGGWTGKRDSLGRHNQDVVVAEVM